MASRALVYVRREDANAPDVVEKISAYVATNSIEVLSLIVDPLVPELFGTETNFVHALIRLHAGEADTLIVENLSSFSADKIEQEILLGHLRIWGIEVLYLDPDVSGDDPERRLLRDFSSRSDLTKRIEGLRLVGKRIAARKRPDQRREGAKPYGELVGEDVVLNKIQAFRAQGMGHSAIANQLNEAGIPTRRKKRWHPTTIANILGARKEVAKRKARKHRVQSSSDAVSKP